MKIKFQYLPIGRNDQEDVMQIISYISVYQ